MEEKEFGKLSKEQLERILALLHRAISDKLELETALKDKPEQFELLIQNAIPWCYFYEIPYIHFLAVFIYSMGLSDQIQDLAKQEDPQEAVITWTENDPEVPDYVYDYTDEEKGMFLSMLMAMLKNIEAIQLFHRSMNDLIIAGRGGNDEAFFDAVLIDRVAVGCPSILERITIAEFANDRDFGNLLSKAITKTRPRRPKPELDFARYMASVLDEAIGLSNMSVEAIYDVLVVDLEVYPAHGADPFEGVKKFVQRRSKSVGDMKR